jgi:gamma-glutamyltranspeptidase
VLRGGEPYLAFGTPGGDQQDQWSLSFFLNHVHFGMNLQEAIDAPAFHTSHFPSSFHPRQSSPLSVSVEERVGRDVAARLGGRGHRVTVRPAVVARAGQRRRPVRRVPVRGGQRPRHAGLRGRPLTQRPAGGARRRSAHRRTR